jgi:tRNA pseudouridine38-40 synthase
MTSESEGASRATLVLVVSYDGSRFAGSQVQPNARTVQGELDRALQRLAGGPVRLVFAGRTDGGVHAAGQVVSLPDPRPDLDAATLAKALNAGLSDDLAVVGVERRPSGFHARYDAHWREYRYRIWAGTPQPLARSFCWQRRGWLDPAAMDDAARRLVGTRDLAALAGGGEGVPWSARQERPRGTVRRIYLCSCRCLTPWWGEPDGTLVEVRVAADGFLPRMVRNIAALLIEVGEGARAPGWIDEVVASRDRRHGGGTAPPHGLILWRVGYGDEEPEPGPEPGPRSDLN